MLFKKIGYSKTLLAAACCTLLWSSACSNSWNVVDDASNTAQDSEEETAGQLTLSGTVTASTSDLAALSLLPPSSSKSRALKTGRLVSADTSAAPGFTVTVYEVAEDGTETAVTGATATTDSSGAYSISGLDAATEDDLGKTTTYYKVCASDSSDTLELCAPVAPSGTEDTASISPGTTLAQGMIDSLGQAGENPSSEVIEQMREMYKKDAETNLADSITLPDNGSANADAVEIFANGLSAAGGVAEKVLKAYQYEAEFYSLASDSTATEEDKGNYIREVINEACNQPTILPVTDLVASVMGAALHEGVQFTISDIVSAYNTFSNQASVNLSDALSSFSTFLSNIETNAASADSTENLTNNDLIALVIKRNLSSSTLAGSTLLDADQALAFIESLNLGNGTVCAGNAKVRNVVAGLTLNSLMTTTAIENVEIFQDSGFGCDENAGQGHFRGEVKVYTPSESSLDVVSVNISGGTINHNETTPQGDRYVFNTNAECVTLGASVTYTVTATFDDASTATTTVVRSHNRVPEASTTVDGNVPSNDVNNPDVLTSKRPLYVWEAPADKLASITGAPAGSEVKYTYEFSHASGGGPLGACQGVQSGRLYSTSSFLPTVDCDIAACAVASSTPEANIVCRMNIQTFLVQDGKILGQAAGHFPVFCVDTNDDGLCSN